MMTKMANIRGTGGGSVTEALPKGYTYFVRHMDMIKIGSSVQPEERIRGLQTGFPHALEVLAVVRMEIADEYQTHQRFAHLRARGEWFHTAPDLLAFIEEIKAAPLPIAPATEIAIADSKKRERDEYDDIVSGLVRKRPHLPLAMQRRVSDIAEQVQRLKTYVRPDWAKDDRQTLPWMIRQNIASLESAMRAIAN